MRAVIRALQDLGLLASRCALGALLLWTAWHRLTGGRGMAAQVDALRVARVPQPALLAWGGTILELLGGIMLIFGLLTPLVALGVIAEQAVIASYLGRPRGFSAAQWGWEWQGVLGAWALLLLVFGAGRLAVDNLFRRPADESTPPNPDAFPTSAG